MASSITSIPLRLTRQGVIHVVRTTIAALVSLLVARLFRLPEAYWATITTLGRHAIDVRRSFYRVVASLRRFGDWRCSGSVVGYILRRERGYVCRRHIRNGNSVRRSAA